MNFTVRQATAQDMEELLRLWQERMDVYLKGEPRKLAAPDTWRQGILEALERPQAAVLVAQRESGLIGYIIGWVWENPPLTEPRQQGLVTELSVDGHCKQGGVGTALLKELSAWFRKQGVTGIEVRVPRRQPIEQAFWRSVGASSYMDHFYYKLD